MNNGAARVVRDDPIETDCDCDCSDEEGEEEEEFIGGGGSGDRGCKSAATICMGFYGDGGIHDRLVGKFIIFHNTKCFKCLDGGWTGVIFEFGCYFHILAYALANSLRPIRWEGFISAVCWGV